MHVGLAVLIRCCILEAPSNEGKTSLLNFNGKLYFISVLFFIFFVAATLRGIRNMKKRWPFLMFIYSNLQLLLS